MQIIREALEVKTKSHCEMVDISAQIQSIVSKSGLSNGDVLIFCPHTTGAITINENADPDVVHDMLLTLEKLIPTRNPSYRHIEGNSDAHVKSSLVGCSETVALHDGRLSLGTWQGIYFCEFDGPRSRKVAIQIRGL